MTQYPHLANFNTSEGHWLDRNLYRPIVQELYANYKIKEILEVGFNIGYSSSMWLEFDPDKKSCITSIDIGIHKDTLPASKAVKDLHGERFSFILCDSKKVLKQLKNKLFDLAFIDGDHTEPGIYNDVHLCLELGVPLLLFDDYYIDNDVHPVKKICEQNFKNKLSLIKVFHLEGHASKIALYSNDTIHTSKNYLARQISFLSPKSPRN
jgi:hypothetical protein